MLTTGSPGDAVWMVVDDEVVAGRLVEAVADKGRVGRIAVKYSDGSEGIRHCMARSVFAESDYAAAKAYAKGSSHE